MANLAVVADALKRGELAVLPTETVYGLAADATNPKAIAKIFTLKGRPSENPLIVHLADFTEATRFAVDISDDAYILADAFYPGPLSIILRKHPDVSDLITAGGDTVALRVPDHTVPLAMMDMHDLALAMPSANLFMGLSPTTAQMVDPSILAGVAACIDGGPCWAGIESTVVDLSGPMPRIMRPGIITKSDVEDVLHQHLATYSPQGTRKSPGQYRRHYAPRTPCDLRKEMDGLPGLTFEIPTADQIQMPNKSGKYAQMLYAAMADMDARGLPHFSIQEPPDEPEWDAIWDRLRKATA